MPEWRMAEPVDFQLCDGEHIAIVGPNAGGKSMLVDILTGRHPLLQRTPEYDFSPSTKPFVSDNIKHITFRDSYGGDNEHTYFLQQRWNQMEIDESTPTVGALLEEAYLLSGSDSPEHRQLQNELYTLFHFDQLLDKYIISLSSGELRKFQLTKVLLTDPRVLIMDNPFIGLDAETRTQLSTLLKTLSEERALQIVLVLSREQKQGLPSKILDHEKEQAILSLPHSTNEYLTQEVVDMNGVSIRYGTRTILKDLHWHVRNGERWSLSGQNGSGKSTLLSLVCADNPQSYACDISLFGIPRGSGESIWDIKKHIGYVSPEMHRAYNRDIPAIKIVASGLKDSVGLYVNPTEEDYEKCRFWMWIFGIETFKRRAKAGTSGTCICERPATLDSRRASTWS